MKSRRVKARQASGCIALFQFAFAVAKQVRTDTHIGDNPVSIAYAAVRLTRQIFSDFDRSPRC